MIKLSPDSKYDILMSRLTDESKKAWLEERCAVRMFDGGQPKDIAEDGAVSDYMQYGIDFFKPKKIMFEKI